MSATAPETSAATMRRWGRALGGYAERIERPEEVVPALQRGRRATQDGRAALLEFITSAEIAYSRKSD